MNTYKVLKNQIVKSENYSLVPIRFEDRYKIMKWRNEQLYHLRQNQPITKEVQDKYFEEVVAKIFDQNLPDQILFSLLDGNDCIGYGGLVHINWVDKNAEISFIMDTEFEKDHFSTYWELYLGLIEKIGFEELELYKLYTYAIDLRPQLYQILELSGYKKEAILRNHVLWIEKKIDVVIHSKFNE